MKQKGLVLLFVLVAAVMASALTAAQPDIEISKVWINDVDAYSGDMDLDRGEVMDVDVLLHALADVEDVDVEVYLSGYQYGSYEKYLVSDSEYITKLDNDSSKKYSFKLEVPVKVDKDEFDLRVRVSGRTGDSIEELFPLQFTGLDRKDAVVIKKFTVMPSDVIVAGSPATFKVTVKNYGDISFDDVYIKVSIPELGIADDESMDEIDADESETFEELLVRVPKCADPGVYDVEAVVEYDNYESTVETMQIRVLKSDLCAVGEDVTPTAPASKTVVTVPESQEVMKGTTGGVYPVMISNLGSTAKTYTLAASGVDAWGTVRFDPAAVVVVQPESVKTVYMYVTANEDAQAGAQVFKLTVESDADSNQAVLSANIADGDAQKDGLRRGLEIGLIVLVIILIILGLIIGFNKIRGDKDDDEESQTYY